MQNSETLHPGKILNEEFLKPGSITINDVSAETEISENHIKNIINGNRAISNNNAKKLAKFLKTKPEYWLDLQRDYDLHIARKLLRGIIPENDAYEEIMINNPHDKLIKLVFSDRSEALAFFQQNLPADLVAKIDWDTLKLEGSKYIDEEMQESESDLLYTVDFKDGTGECFLYLLFEHQSTPQNWMRFRLFKYKARIWDDSLNKKPDQEELKPILSMVFYIGLDDWNYTTEFSDLICKTPLDHEYIPEFKHILFDYSDQFKKLKGAIKARLAYFLIQCHFHGNMKEMFQTLNDLMQSIPKTHGINYVIVFLVYIATTQKEDAKDFIQYMRQNPGNKEKKGGHVMTVLDELRLEGELKGELKGEIKSIEGMLNAGINWQLIYKATGVDSNKFKEMKNKLQSYSLMPMLAEQSSSKDFSYSRATV